MIILDAMFVVTLIANPAGTPLTSAFVDTMARALGAQERVWLKEGVACDLYVPAIDEALVKKTLGDRPYDAIVQPVAGRRKKLFVADMESTMITCECLDELAEYAGLRDKIAAITARAMNGGMDFEQSLAERVGLLEGLPESTLQKVYDEKVRLMPGAEELMRGLKRAGVYTMLVSGGFDFYASRIAEKLGFDEYRANRLEIAGGKLTGRVLPPILDKNGKLQSLEEGCRKLGIAASDAMAVGDGANDLPMLLKAGLGVAFRAKPAVDAAAGAHIRHGDLAALFYVGGF